MPGVLPHPQPCVQMEKAHKQVTADEAETPTFPARCLTAYVRALPGVQTFLVTVACRLSSAGLAPAQGCQDHTPSPYASVPLVA
jgi:hypothetical protein